ncbi:hypothetical protein PMN64_11430 [Bradyrhizobium sp. UFLA01-814]|uniref:hypothetical protein n=1 Tax=Bradyrhizobium sp. UFLA01-814 TaxID=3023480 RepID=UPI00398B0E1C
MSEMPAIVLEKASNNGPVLLGMAECDVHIVANKLSEYELRFVRCKVINRERPQADRGIRLYMSKNPDADASIIGSLNGYEDLNRLQEARRHLIRYPVIGGSNLEITREEEVRTRQTVPSMGEGHVFDQVSELFSTLAGLTRRRSFAVSPGWSIAS